MISYDFEEVKIPYFARRGYSHWIRRVVFSHDLDVGVISYLFCNDEKILEVNKKYLGHDYYTDVITFDYSEGKKISGDILISLDTVKSNSEKFGTKYRDELDRVIIHGVLHLCGINDKGPGEREKMEAAENAALNLR